MVTTLVNLPGGNVATPKVKFVKKKPTVLSKIKKILHLRPSSKSKPPKQADPQPEVTFHGFSKLPPEIRLIIWNFAAPTSRVVNLKVTEDRRTLKQILSRSSTLPELKVYPSWTNPALLYTCWEARLVVRAQFQYFWEQRFTTLGPIRKRGLYFETVKEFRFAVELLTSDTHNTAPKTALMTYIGCAAIVVVGGEMDAESAWFLGMFRLMMHVILDVPSGAGKKKAIEAWIMRGVHHWELPQLRRETRPNVIFLEKEQLRDIGLRMTFDGVDPSLFRIKRRLVKQN